MDFDFTEDQRLLKDMVERFTADHYDLDKRKQYLAQADGFDRANWARLAELGVLALAFGEAAGGLNGGPVELMILMQEFGRALAVEPYIGSVVLAGTLLEACGRHADAARIATGDLVASVAHSEPSARYTLAHVSTSARREGDRYVVSGDKQLVLHGAQSALWLISARLDGGVADANGIGLFLVSADAPGLNMSSYRTVDGMPACDATLRAVPADALLDGNAYPLIESAMARAAFCLSAEALGAMDAMFTATLAYVKTRRQFGQSIGDFQAVQHRMADLYLLCEQARAVVTRAALTDPASGDQWLQYVFAAKAYISEAALKLGHEAIQLHGGMGMTDELAISHYHKRLVMIQMLYGDAAHHIDRYAALALAS